MFNKVILVGNLTREVDLRYTPNGTMVANFGIATNRKYGEGKEETFFGEVTVGTSSQRSALTIYTRVLASCLKAG
jgi:single stranded DNA-binding protein